MVIKSYSKINLSLRVNFKLKKGFHEIQSFYCLINLFDEIDVNKINANKDKIFFKGPFKKLVKKKHNSIYNLMNNLRKLKLITNYYSITVKKNIPVFSGLGGGTSNAAFILKYFVKNKVNESLLSKLENIIGTDLRLFFNKQGFLKDLKSIVKINNKQKFYFLLIQPKIKCSTREIYSKVKKFSKKEQFNKRLTKSKKNILNYLCNNKNDLQFIVEKKYPIIKRLLKDIKSENGCIFSRMTGSGSVCYGLFKDQTVAKKALHKLKLKYPKFWFSLANTV